MESRKHHTARSTGRTRAVFTALAIATASLAAACLPLTAVQAQSTTAMIHGQAPAGETIVAQNSTGVHRTTTVKKNGKFRLGNLPLGVYRVTLKKGDKVIDMYHRVPLLVGSGAEVNFACPHDHCAAP